MFTAYKYWLHFLTDELLFFLYCPKFTLSMLSTIQQIAPQESTPEFKYHHTYNYSKECVITVHLVALECYNSPPHPSVQQVWQLCNISALLSLDQLRTVKGRRQGAFICMQALSHGEGISLRHGESCGLHEAWG